jgi:N6-L-threonylcarbamoyladenine synthase
MTRLMLGVETSCDDTAAAVVTENLEVLSNVVSRQLEVHSRYGGVVPEIAGRVHVSEVIPVISKAMDQAGVKGKDLTAVAVTRGPGLIGSLLVGVSAAKALALTWKKPLVGVNHLEGHLASAALGDNEIDYPCLVLLVSGGHSLMARASSPGTYSVLGSTRDDSVGEAYDKVARLLKLGFPGGPVVDRLAPQGLDVLKFPRPMIHEGLDFSFSGLKSAVANYVRREEDFRVEDVAASFVAAVMDVLLVKLELALDRFPYRSVVVVGGVAASPVLREQLSELEQRRNIKICLPPLAMATDNGAMIAAAAWFQYREKGEDSLDFGADPGLQLPEVS